MFSLRAFAAATAATALLAGAGAGVEAAAAPPPVSRFHDGSFEYPRAPAGLFTPYFPGQDIGPWSVTLGAVDLIGAGTWQAAEGDQSVDLNGTGAVSQTFTTTPGSTYTVTYALAGNPTAADPAVKTGRVLVDGQDSQNFSFDVTGKTYAAMGYVTRRLSFVANASTTTVAFVSTTGPTAANGPVIDDVCIEREPSSCPSCTAG
ncbi:choice-of-anchor C family protein [Streptomyces qinzhouensis]|uniref:Choice-of-anchor C family protein n=1 Tax=Streptomyces qinzhouensis TaxID=2599401 RepID=A0A5B8ISJ8_9ACTN|nr:choice-of-anchor C family protein [Streptomyces qinzhouensis]QDY75169.1 choice-of-anchor C family protein [Streptomyces qinzhouensis]QDY80629.1 choice-of-anchor C family protein [Streptomyces qinzhouensis]